MIPVARAFSARYAEARVKFLEAAATASLPIQSHTHPLAGRDGETLAMDVVLDSPGHGPADTDKLLIISSGCHGVEGYCGSGVQVAALFDAEWREKAHAQGVAVLYIHALNPYGFSHIRRVTQENVDLNRNFHDFSKPLPVNAAYRELQPLLLPEQWPPSPENQTATGQYIATRGMPAFQAAVSGGQHEFPDGMFFGGIAPTWSNQTVRTVLRQQGPGVKKLAWIDLHTGLGPSGHGERIFAGRDDAATLARARAWWGGQVTSMYDGSSTSARLTGMMCLAAYEELPQAEYTAIALEYGTQPMTEVMHALRGEHWLHLHPEAPPELARQIKQQMLEAFYTDADAWKEQIVSQARQAMFQAVDGLSL